MCKFIKIEDLAANAIIDIFEKKGEDRVSFKQIIQYGNTIKKVYEDKYDDYTVIIMSGEAVSSFIRDYSDYFFLERAGGEEYIVLKEGIETVFLREEFRSRLTVELLYSFTCEASLKALGIAA